MDDNDASEDSPPPIFSEAMSPLDLLKQGSERWFTDAVGAAAGEFIAICYFGYWKARASFSSLQPSQRFVPWLLLVTGIFAIAVQPGKSWREPLGAGVELEFSRVLRIVTIAAAVAAVCIAIERLISAIGS